MKRIFCFIILISLAAGISLFWTGCKTKPNVTETTTSTTTTTTTTTASTTTATTDNKKLTDEEIQEAQNLIDKAEKYGAKEYDPENLNNAIEALKNAKDNNSSDFTKAKDFLESSKKFANTAYENAMKGKALAKKDEADKLLAEAENLSADKIYKNEFSKIKDMYSEGEKNLSDKKYEDAFNSYSDCKNALDSLITSAKSIRGEFETRIAEIKKIIGEADKLGANTYAKDDFAKANDYLEKGVTDYTDLNLDSSKTNLDDAEKYAQSALDKTRLALKEIKRKEAVKAIIEAGKSIEDASKKPSIDSNDKKTNQNYKFEFDETDKNMNNSPDDQVSYKDILTKSIDYIEKAKEAYRNEDYDQAIKYAEIAKKLALTYQGDGIKTSYKVRLIPEKRDCLWRISEYSYIYGDPFLWPRIWKANKTIILNPDLIYPGQVFLIPEMD
jgi:hypothetical protein